MKQSVKEVAKYGIVGVVGLGVDWIAFFIFRDFFGLNYITSHVLGSILAITNNFLLNSYFTFKATDKIWQRALSFFGIAGIGLLVSSFLLPFFVQIISITLSYIDFSLSDKIIQNLSKLIVTVIVAALQFVLNKFYTFKKKEVE